MAPRGIDPDAGALRVSGRGPGRGPGGAALTRGSGGHYPVRPRPPPPNQAILSAPEGGFCSQDDYLLCVKK